MKDFDIGVAVEDTAAETAAPQYEDDALPGDPEDSDGEGPEHTPEIPNEVWKKARERAEREASARLESTVNQRVKKALEEERYARYPGGVNPDERRGIDSPELVGSLIDDHPSIKRAQAVLEQTRSEEGRRLLSEQLREVSALDPSIKTFEDFARLPNRAEIDELVLRRGYSLVDAYRIANFDRLTQEKTAAAKQAAINAVNSKAHLLPTGSGAGSALAEVPAEVYAEYRRLLPSASKAEIIRHYNKSIK